MTTPTYNYAGSAPISLIAGAAITANRLLKLDSSGNVIMTTAITDRVIGVSLKTVASGEPCEFMSVNGAQAKLECKSAVAIGDELMPYAAGATAADQGKVATAAGATAVSCGVALSATAADGEMCGAIFRPSVKSPANS